MVYTGVSLTQSGRRFAYSQKLAFFEVGIIGFNSQLIYSLTNLKTQGYYELIVKKEVFMEIVKPAKAKKVTFKLGSLVLDGYQLSDGSYRMSQTQVSAVIGKADNSVLQFLAGKSPQALPHKGFGLQKLKVEGVQNYVCSITLEVAKAYWLYWALNGDTRAISFWNKAFSEPKFKEKSTENTSYKEGFIYLFEGSNVLKLGFSKDVHTRLKKLSRWDGELELITHKVGTISTEKILHRKLHLTGESFGDEWYPIYRKNEILALIYSS